jgi:TRAP-type C4-dicarboxylate transport system permease small subunit
MEAFNKLSLAIDSLIRKLVVLVMVFMVCTVLLDVLARNSAIRVRGLDELARFSLVWLVFLVTAVGARYGDLIGMESLFNALPARVRKVLWVVRRVLFLVFLALFGWFALGLVQFQAARTSPNLHIPLWFVYAPIFLGTLLMFVSLVADMGVRFARGTIDADSDMQPGDTSWN